MDQGSVCQADQNQLVTRSQCVWLGLGVSAEDISGLSLGTKNEVQLNLSQNCL